MTTSTRIVAFTALSALVGLGALAVTQRSAGQPSRVVDRTVLCATDPSGGIYEVEVTARAGFRSGRSAWDKPATVKLTTGSVGSAGKALDNAIGWAIAGRPTDDATVISDPFPGFTYPIHDWGTFAMNVRCRPSRARVALSTKKLSGGAAGQLGETFDCQTPRRILVRMRASFEAPANLSRHGQFLLTGTTVAQGQLAVRTEAGAPIAYASVNSLGAARLFTARRCSRD